MVFKGKETAATPLGFSFRLAISPRAFSNGKRRFKGRRRPTRPPSDEDISNMIIGHGLPGSGMPSFQTLEAGTKNALLQYVKSISPAFATGQKPQPIELPSNMKARPDLKKGMEVYGTLQCAACHGAGGHANGPSSKTLTDKWGRPLAPANLTQGWTYRGGHRPLDIYCRIMAGIEGAPMPSYAEAGFSKEDIWQLSQYVASLQLDANFSGEIRAHQVKGSLPTDAADEAWKQAPRTDVNMNNYVYANGKRQPLTVRAASVQSLFNEDEIAFRVFWEDPNQNDTGNADAFLVAFMPSDYQGKSRSSLLNAYESDAAPLDLVMWKASSPTSMRRSRSNIATAVRGASAEGEDVASSAVYEDGRWVLMFRQRLPTVKGEASLHQPIQVSFAAWDGANGETGLKYSASDWKWLSSGAEKAHH
jgi:DMSO reductase family type II enzyme heme b subunit